MNSLFIICKKKLVIVINKNWKQEGPKFDPRGTPEFTTYEFDLQLLYWTYYVHRWWKDYMKSQRIYGKYFKRRKSNMYSKLSIGYNLFVHILSDDHTVFFSLKVLSFFFLRKIHIGIAMKSAQVNISENFSIWSKMLKTKSIKLD